jgi:aspartate 1-decarboxylase
MNVVMLKSKLHFAHVTEAEPDYEGSLTIDPDLLETVGMFPYEKILVANCTNGKRFETYAICGKRGSKVIGLNGATTHMGSVGDKIIIFSFCHIPKDEAAAHRPLVQLLDKQNNPVGGLAEV